MERHTKKQIENMAKLAKVCVSMTSPGDRYGTRYEFLTPGDKPHTYGRTLGYCLGAREAYLFLRGYQEGLWAKK